RRGGAGSEPTRAGRGRTDRRALLPSSRVATRRKEGFAQRVAGEGLLEKDPPQVGMAVELDAEHVVRLSLAPVRAFPHAAERGNVRVELRAGRAEHREHVRARATDERHRPQLPARVDAGVHRVEIASQERVVTDESRDLNEAVTIDI